MTGFFTIKETESKSRPGGKNYSCISCGAYKHCITARMKPAGDFAKKILIIGGSPEKIDDEQGLPFQSRFGKLLERALQRLGINMWDDCLLTNACHCCVTDEEDNVRVPTNYEIECCRKTTLRIIEEYRPKLIILLGNSALFSLIGHRWKKDLGNIEKWRGWTIPDQDFRTWICPIYDPKEVLNSKKEEVETIWEQDLSNALSKLQESISIYKEPEIQILQGNDLSILKTIKYPFAFDYETTGLKPHGPGHAIVCVSIAVNSDLVYVFEMPKTRAERRPFVQLLADPNIGKIAQNMKFEHSWSSVRLKQPVVNWVWDTMLATHVLDNRPGVTGLKFQTYVQFGIVDYDSEVSPYLRAVDNVNANSINRIMELCALPGGKEKLLTYCAYDSIYEYRLSQMQMSIIDELPF